MYYTKKNRDIDRGMNSFEEENIKYDEEMLADRVGISTKVLKNARQLKHMKNYVSIDDNKVLQLRTKIDTPEEYVEKKGIL